MDRRRSVWMLSMSFLSLLPAAGFANVGPPSRGGQPVGDPVGIVDVDIDRETLNIDLRPLAHGGLAEVEAIYRLNNRGPARTLDLLFASGSARTADFRVWLGDQPIASMPARDARLPASWQPPRETPALPNTDRSPELDYHPWPASPIAFTLTIPSGRQELKVRYAAELTENRNGTPTLFHQFAYVLAPAKSWSRFGGLDVTVQVPDGWQTATSPNLHRDGDTLRASFEELPADSLTLTLQAPAGWLYRLLKIASVGLLAVVGIGGLMTCYVRGRRDWPETLALAFGWGFAFWAASAFATFGIDAGLPAGQVSHYGYDQPIAMLGFTLLSVLLVPIGFLVAQFGARDPK
jgi:hypothetical protein